MFRREFIHGLGIVMICGLLAGGQAQTKIEPPREIHLPVPASRGSYDHFPFSNMAARDHFSMRVAPDQSVLVFDSDTSGQWPLVRVREWWTDHPVEEVLSIPGWSAADAEYMDKVYVDVQVTPDGRYAVVFGKALWKGRSDFLFHVPKGYVARKPETIVSVVDLEHWRIVSSVHTASIGDVDVRDARVLNSEWIGFDGAIDASHTKFGVYRYADRLLSIPDLKSGPQCVSQRFSHIGQAAPGSVVDAVRAQNDAACGEVFRAAGAGSTEVMEARLQRDSDVEPKAMKLRDVERKDDYLEKVSHHELGEAARLWDADGEADDFFRYWGEYPYNENYAQNPPFESSSHLWYGLYGAPERGLYELDKYDAVGKKLGTETARTLLCGDPSLGHPKSACGCRVIDVSERQHTLLVYCRQQHGDFAGMVQRQWLSVFRSDDLSGVGIIDVPKDSETLQAIADGDGRAYVVTLKHGEVLDAYAVPGRL